MLQPSTKPEEEDEIMTIRKWIIYARAISRLTPKMAAFMVRRLLRNKLAPRFPGLYQARIDANLALVPELSSTAKPRESVAEMARIYDTAFEHSIDDAAQGRITLFGRLIDFGSPTDIAWERTIPEEGDHQLWRLSLNYMGYVCSMLVHGEARHHAAVREMIISFEERLNMTDSGAFHSYWFPYGVSQRILALTSGLLLAQNKGLIDPETDRIVRNFLRRNVAFLLDNIEFELRNNHVERNLAALALYYSYTTDTPTIIAKKLEHAIQDIVKSTLLPDGTQIERSSMYQGLTVASLRVLSDAPFLSNDLKQHLAKCTSEATRAFAILSHPDGEVSLFNDAWHDEAPPFNGEGVSDGLSMLPEAGYARLSKGDDMCLLDAGAIGPSWNPGHGHSDFLALEIDLHGQRFIVDPGTSQYDSGPERQRERSAAAHNGPTWRNYEPVEYFGSFRVGRMVSAKLITPKLEPNFSAPTMAGALKSRAGQTARMVAMFDNGFLVADVWTMAFPVGQVKWLVPASWTVMSEINGWEFRSTAGSARIQFLTAADFGDPQPSTWTRHYGRLSPAIEVAANAEVLRDKQHLLTWIGKDRSTDETESAGKLMLESLYKEISK